MSASEEYEQQSPFTSLSSQDRELPPIPTTTPSIPSFSESQEGYVPLWMQDTASTTSTTRQSRASSIVSTLTRFTTTSIDDARSIDIHVGGQNFRIARDASKITSEAPPPYSVDANPTGSHVYEDEHPRTTPLQMPPGDNRSDRPLGLPTRPGLITSPGANILDPSEVDIPSPTGEDDITPPSTPRNSSRTPRRNFAGPDGSIQHHFAGNEAQIDSRPSLNRNVTIKPYRHSGRHQRADLPLLSTTSNISEMQGMRSSQYKALRTMSVDDLLLSHIKKMPQEPHSPDYIGRNADGIFPQNAASQIRLRGDSGYSGEDVLKEDSNNETSAMDSENDVSLHYARMIRFVDKQHRRALHTRDKEMEKLRERLAEVDTIYRQQLKARDFIIDDLKRRLEHVEDLMEARLEKARNEVEDLWERRWKDRERVSRIESQASLDLQNSRDNLFDHLEERQ